MEGHSAPPPPPHGSNSKESSSSSSSSGLPHGNYDIFIIPPHSAGGGFLYLPSLRPQPHSFVAGVVCTLVVVYVWMTVQPVIKAWVNTVSQSGGGFGIAVLMLAVGFAGWVWGKSNIEQLRGARGFFSGMGGGTGSGAMPGAHQYGRPPNGHAHAGPTPNGNAGSAGSAGGRWGRGANASSANAGFGANARSAGGAFGTDNRQRTAGPAGSDNANPSKAQGTNPNNRPNGKAPDSWEKAREETRKREEERKRAEEMKRKQDEDKKKREDADRAARATAEKEKWEQMRAREKETRERETREKLARERMAKEKAGGTTTTEERAEKLRSERAAANDRSQSEKAVPTFGVGERTNPYSPSSPSKNPKKYQHPTAQSYTGTATDTAFRPYDTPPRPKHTSSQSSFFSTYSDSYAASESTAHTSPPPSHSGPYSTKDPDKIMIRGAYKFTDLFPKPIGVVKPGEEGITDGLIMRVTTEGVFLDDDKKRDPLRQWDIKAWSMKGFETATKSGHYIVRISIRDPENTKYVFIVPDSEEWKFTAGIKRLRSGTQIRHLNLATLSNSDTGKLLGLVSGA